MKLVPDASKVWTYYSAQIYAFLVVVPIIWQQIPDEIKDYLPESWRPWVIALFALSGLAGRYIDQGGTSNRG